jgi:hypothetical protein
MFSCGYDHFGIGVGIEFEQESKLEHESKCSHTFKTTATHTKVIPPDTTRIISPKQQPTDNNANNNKFSSKNIHRILFYKDNLQSFPILYSFPDKENEILKPYLNFLSTLDINEYACNNNINKCLDIVCIIFQKFSEIYYKVHPKNVNQIDSGSHFIFQSQLYSHPNIKYTPPLFIKELSDICDEIDTFVARISYKPL